jgi:hypothetical protein
METITELTPISISLVVLYIIVKEVVSPLVKRRNGNGNGKIKFVDIIQMEKNVSSLHDMHNQKDNEGRYLWYNPTGFKRTLEANTRATAEMTIELKRLNRNYKNGK